MLKRLCLAAVIWIASAIGSLALDKAGPLVTSDWLKQNLDNKELVILDIRSPRPTRNFFAEGHIPGSVSAPYNDGWRVDVGNVIGMLPPVEEITDHIRSLGIDNNEHVVIVPFGNSSTDFGAATRVYWTFKVLGHDAVSILDGGYQAWYNANAPLSNKSAPIKRGKFVAEFNPDLIAVQGDVQQTLRGGADLIDARPQSQYLGKAKSPVVSKAGTIPNAVNIRQSLFYKPSTASFASLPEITKLLENPDLNPDETKITFCNTGHWASLAWFAFSEIAGKQNVKMYDGSMAEWTLNEGNPVETPGG